METFKHFLVGCVGGAIVSFLWVSFAGAVPHLVEGERVIVDVHMERCAGQKVRVNEIGDAEAWMLWATKQIDDQELYRKIGGVDRGEAFSSDDAVSVARTVVARCDKI